MTMQLALPIDGHCCGPLFAPLHKRRMPKRRQGDSGGSEVWKKWMRSRPSLEDRRVFYDMVRLGRIYTEFTGIQYSVDHVVPINHPLVCGFHRVANFAVIPLVDNTHKSNNWWPDMPEVQGTLCLE